MGLHNSEVDDQNTAVSGGSQNHVITPSDASAPLRTSDNRKASQKPPSQVNLTVPPRQSRARSQSPDSISLISAEDFGELRQVHSNVSYAFDANDEEGQSLPKWKRRIRDSWRRNLGLFLVLLSLVFSQLMAVTTRMLENDGEGGGMHPFQIIFARMVITTTLSMLYMWYNETPHFPFGAPEVRWLLVARGVGGFVGVFGLYWSLRYLTISDATVLTFIAPFLSCWVCSYISHEPFTRIERIGGAVSLIGVVLIARPASIFSTDEESDQTVAVGNATVVDKVPRQAADPIPEATSSQHLQAVGMAMVGVCGATVAYVTIRSIGKRAHPLISVNYFAFWCTVVSSLALAFVPSIPFILPSTSKQWLLLIYIGVSGFVMQFLLTAGLRYEKGSRTTNMIYCQELFALFFDHVFWGVVPTLMSMLGSSLILVSAITVAVQKETGKVEVKPTDPLNDEERGLVEEDGDAERVEMEDHNTTNVMASRHRQSDDDFQ